MRHLLGFVAWLLAGTLIAFVWLLVEVFCCLFLGVFVSAEKAERVSDLMSVGLAFYVLLWPITYLVWAAYRVLSWWSASMEQQYGSMQNGKARTEALRNLR